MTASGEDVGAVSTAAHAARVPARRAGLASNDVRTSAQRHSRRRNGTREDHPDDRTARVPRM